MRALPLLAALVAAPALNGCVALGAAAGASVGVMAMQDRPIGEGIDDALASNTIKSRLAALDRPAYRQVDVEVAAGRVLLSGPAPTQEHRDMAEFVARSVRGVSEVYNEIQIGEPDRLMRNTGDEMITAQVRTRLLASPNVRGVNINVETHRGTVYLMGVVASDAELQRAAEIASVTSGVTRVVSLMDVRASRAAVGEAQAFQPTVTTAETRW